MKFLPGTKVIRFKSIILPDDFEARLTDPEVLALAANIAANGGVPAHPPVVRWMPRGNPRLTCGGNRLAALVVNGLKREGVTEDTDGMVEVRAFEGTDADEARLRRDENIHRRQDRDRWLREQVEETARDLAAERAKDSTVAPKTAPSEGGGARQEPVAPPPLEVDAGEQLMCNVDCGGTPCGHPVGESGVCASGHDWTPAGVFKGARLLGVQNVVEQQAGDPPRPLVPTKADKVAARKKVAAKTGTTPAAVKQAEQRDRAKRGETKPAREKHDDGGAALDHDQLRVQRVYIDVLASVDQAITRIANHIAKQPDTVLNVNLAGLRMWRDDFKAARKAAGL